MLQYPRIYPVFWSASFFPKRKVMMSIISSIWQSWNQKMLGESHVWTKILFARSWKGFTFPICGQCLISKAFQAMPHPKVTRWPQPNPRQRNPQRRKFKKSHVNQIGKENVAQINLHIDCKIGCVAVVTLVSLIWKTTRLDWVQKFDHWKCPTYS